MVFDYHIPFRRDVTLVSARRSAASRELPASSRHSSRFQRMAEREASDNRISINFRGYSFLRPRCKPTRDSAADRVAPDVVRVARP